MIIGPDPHRALQLIDNLGLYMVIFTDPTVNPSSPGHLQTWSQAYNTLGSIILPGLDNVSHNQIHRLLLKSEDGSLQATYQAWLLCSLAPWTTISLEMPGRNNTACPVTAMVVKNGLKGAGTEAAQMVKNAAGAVENIWKMRDLPTPTGLPIKMPLRTDADRKYRLEQGNAIRLWGPGWRNSVLYALLVDLIKLHDFETSKLSRSRVAPVC